MAFSPDGKLLATAGENGDLRVVERPREGDGPWVFTETAAPGHYRLTPDPPLPGAEALLNSLHGEFGLALATNGLKEVQRPRLVKSGLTSFFKVIVVSDEIGHAKPDAGFFDHAFHEMGRPDPGRVLMVGDNLNADILGSMSYGIDACWFNPDRLQPYLDIEPDYQIHDLSEVLKLVNSAER